MIQYRWISDVITRSPAKVKRRKHNTSTIPTTTRLSTKHKATPTVSTVAASLQQKNTTCMSECREPMVKITDRDDPLYNKVGFFTIIQIYQTEGASDGGMTRHFVP